MHACASASILKLLKGSLDSFEISHLIFNFLICYFFYRVTALSDLELPSTKLVSETPHSFFIEFLQVCTFLSYDVKMCAWF